jgi:hypothetical protein
MAQHRIQIFNGKKRKGRTKGKRPKSNPLSFLFNGGANMASKKRGKGRRNRRASSNPGRKYRGRMKRHTRSNPFREGRQGMGADFESIAATAVTVATAQLVEGTALSAWNSGIAGYGLDLAIGAGLFFLAGKMVSKRAASGVIGGTVANVVLRGLSDMRATPHVAVQANVRAAQAVTPGPGVSGYPGYGGMSGMGTTVPWPFRQPQIYANLPGSAALPFPVSAPPPAVANGGGYGNGMGRLMSRSALARRR